jgi:hypothetical protein
MDGAITYQKSSMMPFPCPCCRFLTIADEPPGTLQVCPVCFWEDDFVQFHDLSFAGGANSMSLNEARENFQSFKACGLAFCEKVRQPLPNEFP